MTKDIDCQLFEDQLDALVEGALPEEGKIQLRLHAAGCQECATRLRVHHHLVGPTLEELEAAVPEDLLAGLWPRVQGELATRRAGMESAPNGSAAPRVWPPAGGSGASAGTRAGRPAFRRAPWLVPTLAAATLALAFYSGFQTAEIRQLRGREEALSRQVEDQQRILGEPSQEASTEAVARTAALARRAPWLWTVSRQETMTLGELRAFLAAMPPDRTLLNTSQVDALLRSASSLTPALWKDALGAMEPGRSLQVRDLLDILGALKVSPETTLPTSKLLELLS